MALPAFSIDLGGGMYLDSDGSLHSGAKPDIPVYALPGGKLPIDPAKIKDALAGITTALPSGGDAIKLAEFNKFADMLAAVGVADDLIEFAGVLGAIAGVAATVMPIVGAAVAVIGLLFKLFGGSGGPSAEDVMLSKIMERFDRLDKMNYIAENNSHLQYIVPRRNNITMALIQLKKYFDEVTKFNPTPARLNQLYHDLEQSVNSAFIDAKTLTDESPTWHYMFNPNNYSQTWGMIANQVYTRPGGGPPVRRSMPAAGDDRFDPRLIPMHALYAANSLMMLVKGFQPEFRSTGEFADQFALIAANLDNLATRMRDEILGFTRYSAINFTTWVWYTQVITQTVEGPFGLPVQIPIAIDGDQFGWTVGALDLAAHTNGYFNSLPQGTDIFHPYKKANLNFRWVPPAEFGPLTNEMYAITNPQACADAANQQAERDYADLMLTSGYLQLAQAATLMHHLILPPDRSETVSGDSLLERKPGQGVNVTVESDPIPLTGVITSGALMEPQEFRAHVSLKVQPIRNELHRALSYRIYLRTFYDSSHDTDYANYYRAGYRANPADRRSQILEVNLTGSVLDQKLLASRDGRDIIVAPNQPIELQAYSYDWYVKVESPWADEFDPEHTSVFTKLIGAGWDKDTAMLAASDRFKLMGNDVPPVMHTLGNHGRDLFDKFGPFIETLETEGIRDLLGWKDGARDWNGEQRHRRKSTVTIDWDLAWVNSRVEIDLRGRSDDRNYLMFVVVEEDLPLANATLHTWYPIPMVGQLTYVPASFFRREQAAKEHAAKVFGDFNRRYSESHEPGPADPIIGKVHPGDLISAASLARVFDLADRNAPELLQMSIRAVEAEEAGEGSLGGETTTGETTTTTAAD